MDKQEIKDFLELKYRQYNRPEFIESDPIYFPHLFSKKQDIEIMGFLIATIAWGNRKSILKNGQKLVQIMEESPLEFVQNYTERDLKFVHRTFNGVDLNFFFLALKNIYQAHNSLEEAFSLNKDEKGMKSRIINFRNTFLSVPHEYRAEKHISNPANGSSAKRINMFLRWMVRKDNCGVDFTLWKTIQPSELYLPLDIHTGNIGRKLGILTRQQNDWKALEEIQSILREFDPKDPVKYDFALFGIGVNGEI